MLAFWQARSLELMRDEISRWGVSKRTVAFIRVYAVFTVDVFSVSPTRV